MNDPAFLATGTMSVMRTGANVGLPDKLVQDGFIAEDALANAIKASREAKQGLVSWLVAKNLVAAKDIAVTASSMFGVPLMDLDALTLDMEVVRLVNDKLLQKHLSLIHIS
jgi:type IV pilus assembly protein PilB